MQACLQVKLAKLQRNEQLMRGDQQAEPEAGDSVEKPELEDIHPDEPPQPPGRKPRVDVALEKTPAAHRIADEARPQSGRFLLAGVVKDLCFERRMAVGLGDVGFKTAAIFVLKQSFD